MRKLLDTWAWIEYYAGSEAGEKVSAALEEECLTSVVSLVELNDNFHRKQVAGNYSWEEVEGYVRNNSRIVPIDSNIIARSGKIKKRKREEFPDFGLMDAIILATAEEKNLELVTGDPHLVEVEIAKDIRT